jgi:hypothetical protein
MFGSFFIERDPLRFKDLPSGLTAWTQETGGAAAVGLVIFAILWECGLFRKATADLPGWLSFLFRVGLALTALAYLPSFLVLLYDLWVAFANWSAGTKIAINGPGQSMQERLESLRRFGYQPSLTIGGILALLTAGLPFFRNLAALRVRRIWALSKLSFKEALRNRILYAFTGLLLVILFGSWFLPHKPEDQVRSYVQVIYWGMTPLLLLAAAILASFSIPADIRQQTIHTIVTKPVERFEVVLGRFLGFGALMTLILVGMSAVSLMYVIRGVDPDAAAESLKAREPIYGSLRFENTGSDAGENVGREWDYRSYITAPLDPTGAKPTAVWEMPRVSDSVAGRKGVRCEFSFDIYRTTKGNENKGVSCNFVFIAAGAKGDERVYADKLREARRAGGKTDAEIEDQLAEELGVYPKLSQEVTDNHTQAFNIPGGLLRAANKSAADPEKALFVRVTCNDRTQYVGMAKYDFYLRADDPATGDDRLRFAANFFKGTTGLWLRLMLVTGLAVALSTYFSGVIALLVTMMLYVGGLFRDFIGSVAEGSNAGGGPLEAMYRLTRGENIVAPLEQTATIKFATYSDQVYRWLIGRVMEVIPDIDRFDLTSYVAEGFNIPSGQLVLNLLLLIGYILPWAVLAFYLIKWREIASPS